jgi:hypothetical protein
MLQTWQDLLPSGSGFFVFPFSFCYCTQGTTMSKETLTVTFQSTRYQKPVDDDGLCWGIYVCQETVITGKLDPAICRRDMCFEVVGQWETHARYGKQFKFHSYSRRQPNGPWGTIAFLMQADNIGKVTAERIYDYFGENSIKAVIDRPEKVATDCGIRLDVVQAAGETLSPLIGEAAGKLRGREDQGQPVRPHAAPRRRVQASRQPASQAEAPEGHARASPSGVQADLHRQE